jgi:hypothetical protein
MEEVYFACTPKSTENILSRKIFLEMAELVRRAGKKIPAGAGKLLLAQQQEQE